MKTSPYGPNNKFSFLLALKAEPVDEVQILRTATATACDGRNFFFRSNHVFSHKKS
jgi:hypothetical protein